LRYRRRRPDDAQVRKRLRELAAMRRRFRYRRLHILLTREDMTMNHVAPKQLCDVRIDLVAKNGNLIAKAEHVRRHREGSHPLVSAKTRG
jgi:hypothetical protein